MKDIATQLAVVMDQFSNENLVTSLTPLIGEQGTSFLEGVPEAKYKDILGVRSSWLKGLNRSPAHFLEDLRADLKGERVTTPAMQFGTLVHDYLLLGPETLSSRYTPCPDEINLNSKEGRALKEKAEQNGLPLIRVEAFKRAAECAQTLLADPTFNQVFGKSLKEVCVTGFRHTPSGCIKTKARIDLLTKGDFLADLKVVNNATPESFAYKILDFGYHTQAAHYLDTFNQAQDLGGNLPEGFNQERSKFLITAVESEPPYAFRHYVLSPEYLELGRRTREDALNLLAHCICTREFAGYDPGYTILSPPPRRDPSKYTMLLE